MKCGELRIPLKLKALGKIVVDRILIDSSAEQGPVVQS